MAPSGLQDVVTVGVGVSKHVGVWNQGTQGTLDWNHSRSRGEQGLELGLDCEAVETLGHEHILKLGLGHVGAQEQELQLGLELGRQQSLRLDLAREMELGLELEPEFV